MSPLPSADEPPSAAARNPSCWLFTWEAQSHTPTLSLVLFNPETKPSAQCRYLKVEFISEQSLLTVSFLQTGDQHENSVRVPVPRVLIDPESPLHFRALDDNIEVKLVLLLPVDHPLVSDFDSILHFERNTDELHPLSMDSDLEKLSCMKEVHFYCRNCSTMLTKSLSCFEEMPSVNWRDAADNWFGNCCCSFGGVSEKLVEKFVKSYACEPGICLLSTTSVLLCKNDLLMCKFPEVKDKQKFKSNLNSPNCSCFSEVSPDGICKRVQVGCCGNHDKGVPDKYLNSSHAVYNGLADMEEVSKEAVDDDSLSCSFPALQIKENTDFMNGSSHSGNLHTGCCTPNVSGTSSMGEPNGAAFEFFENQKVFLDGFLGSGFMVRSSGLSKEILWEEFLCAQCSCLLGAYPRFDDNVPLDGGVRLFKCCISTSSSSDDAFRNYTLERMFTNQLLESAEDELSFRTVVRDIKTKSPMLQIVLLNPNSWFCTGSLQHPMESAAKLVMYPTVKVLFSACNPDMKFTSKSLEDWVRENQVDEVYMFSSQITELLRALEVANSQSPPSFRSLQGLLLSSMKR